MNPLKVPIQTGTTHQRPTSDSSASGSDSRNLRPVAAVVKSRPALSLVIIDARGIGAGPAPAGDRLVPASVHYLGAGVVRRERRWAPVTARQVTEIVAGGWPLDLWQRIPIRKQTALLRAASRHRSTCTPSPVVSHSQRHQCNCLRGNIAPAALATIAGNHLARLRGTPVRTDRDGASVSTRSSRHSASHPKEIKL